MGIGMQNAWRIINMRKNKNGNHAQTQFNEVTLQGTVMFYYSQKHMHWILNKCLLRKKRRDGKKHRKCLEILPELLGT